MAAATHSVVVTFDTDLRSEAAQRDGLERFIVPSLRSPAGFISGHWTLHRSASISIAFLTFSSVDAAQAFADNLQENSEAQRSIGLMPVSVRVAEIQASA